MDYLCRNQIATEMKAKCLLSAAISGQLDGACNRLPPFSKVYRHRDMGRCFLGVNLKKDSIAPETEIRNGKLCSHSRCGCKMAVTISLCVEIQDFAIGQVGSNIYDVSPSVLKQGPPSRDHLPFYNGDI